MKRNISVFFTVILIVILGEQPGRSLPKSFADEMLDDNYQEAEKILGEIDDPVERLFGRAMLAKQQENYRRSRQLFRRLVRNHPENTRATDAEFFLDRIKLRGVRTRAPLVRVQLDETSRISGTITGTGRVETDGEDRIVNLQPGIKWTVKPARNGNVTLTFSSGPEDLTEVNEIRLRPSSSSSYLAHDGTRYRGDFLLRQTEDGRVGLINRLPVEEYLYGVVRKEIAPNWPVEVIRAQAVAARSFVVARMRGADNGEQFDVQSTHLSQVYGGYDAEDTQIRQAVDATAGQVLTYENRVVPAYYHANSGGHIETAETVWESARTPYIVSRQDTWSVSAQHARWNETLTQRKIVQGLRKSDLPDPSTPLYLEREDRLTSGRTRTLSYRSSGAGRTEVNANDFRIAVGPEELKSTWFETIDEGSSQIEFYGRGWGHGIGLSQWGARSMAQSGLSHRKILNFYYAEAELLGGYGLGAAHGENVINE